MAQAILRDQQIQADLTECGQCPVDAHNLYYADRKLCGRGVPGRRWLDLISMTWSPTGS